MLILLKLMQIVLGANLLIIDEHVETLLPQIHITIPIIWKIYQACQVMIHCVNETCAILFRYKIVELWCMHSSLKTESI